LKKKMMLQHIVRGSRAPKKKLAERLGRFYHAARSTPASGSSRRNAQQFAAVTTTSQRTTPTTTTNNRNHPQRRFQSSAAAEADGQGKSSSFGRDATLFGLALGAAGSFYLYNIMN